VTVCSDSWESLRGDPLPWLLDSNQPNLHWRVLVDLVRRPAESPAVVRARGGANAVEPIASLLHDLHPDGTWAGDPPLWNRYSGSGWRILAAVQWGADPTDPRLQAAAGRLLEEAPGEGGFSRVACDRELPWLTARILQGLAALGWCRHPRFQEALAWLEDGETAHPSGGWRVTDRRSTLSECPVTAVAVLDTLTACRDERRRAVRDRAVGSLFRGFGATGRHPVILGHPCLGRTDDAEILSTLARASIPLVQAAISALGGVQRSQRDGGRWHRGIAIPRSLPASIDENPGRPSRWVTLKCVTALMTYAVDGRLPRMYPQKPV
jgi:hypothetical protein